MSYASGVSSPIHVLLADDNPADADLTREALDHSRLHVNLSVVRDGVEAMDFLHQRNAFEGVERPDLILLDLNMPRMDGREVLAAVKSDADFQTIPVVVLTSSDAEMDVVKSYELGANCYVTKPVDLRAFQEIVNAVNDFWFTVVKLPVASPKV